MADLYKKPISLVSRPDRSEKAGFQDRSSSMSGRDISFDLAKDGHVDDDSKGVSEFDSNDDWMLTIILVALMKANPEMSEDDAIQTGKDWARRLWLPNSSYLWRRQVIRMKQRGIRAEASRIRRELYDLL